MSLQTSNYTILLGTYWDHSFDPREVLQNPRKLGFNVRMANKLLESLEAIRGKGYRGFFSSVFNIEGGRVAISDERMLRCESCYESYSTTIDCKICARTSSNFIQFKSGEGDGLYGIFSLFSKSEQLGALLIFDTDLVDLSISAVSEGASLVFDLDFSEVLDEMDGVCIGKIEIQGDPGGSSESHCLYVGDSGADASGSYALPYFFGAPGEYSVILFGDNQAAIVIQTNRLKEFALTDKHKFTSEQIQKLAIGSPEDVVQGHLQPAGIDAVEFNVALQGSELERVNFDEDEFMIPIQYETFVSWEIQLLDFAPDLVSKDRKSELSAIPTNEFEEARKQAAGLRGYILPPSGYKPKKRSLFRT